MSDYKRKHEKLAALRQNMANKMVAGLDYDYEAEQIALISAELKAIDAAVSARSRKV